MKRIAALLLTLAMLLSAGSGALAAAHTHNWVFSGVDYTTCTGPAYYVYVCECGESYTETMPGPGHDYQRSVYQEPTCTNSGYASFTCTRCGDTYREQYSPLGHAWGGWHTTKSGTCVDNGEEERACSRCGETETRSIPASGSHDWNDWKVEVPGDCVTIEMRSRTCSRCGKTEYQNWGYGDHDWGEWEVETPATPGAPGVEKRVCKLNHNHTEARDLPYTGDAATGSLTVTKHVVSQEGMQETKRFSFTVTLGDASINGNYGGMTFSDGVANFTLAKEQSLTASGLPVGTFYAVEELGVPGYKIDSENSSGVITQNGANAVFTNTRSFITVSARIEWDDQNNQAGKRPDQVNVSCYRWGGEIIGGYLTEGSGWKNNGFEVMEYGDDGVWIEYSWVLDASALPEGYTASSTEIKAANAVFTIRYGADSKKGADDKTPAPALSLSITQTSEVKSFYTEGEKVTFDVTLKNTGNVPLHDCAVDLTDNLSLILTNKTFGGLEPNQSATRDFTFEIQKPYVDAGSVVAHFAGYGYLDGYEWDGHAAPAADTAGLVWSNTEDATLQTSEPVPPPSKVTYGPELSLTVICLDPEPFYFDVSGKTGEKHYQAVVSNLGVEACWVTTITVSTAGGSRTVPIEAVQLFPHDSTPAIPLTNDFDEGEIASDGKLHISFIANGGTAYALFDSNPVSLAHEVSKNPPPWVPPVETRLIVEKNEVGFPADPNGYALGETVNYEVWVFNDSEVLIPSAVITDPLCGSPITLTDLEPGTWQHTSYSYTVTQQDVDNKKIDNIATVTWIDPETKVEQSEKSNQITVFTIGQKENEVWIKITFEKEPANGSFYVEGESIPIRVDWGNSGQEKLYHVNVTDSLANYLGLAPYNSFYLAYDGTLEPGEFWSFAYTYVPGSWDAESYKKVCDLAMIDAYDLSGNFYSAVDSVEKPVDVEKPDPETETPGLKVEKKETSHSTNPAYYVEGETITYEIILTNIGNVDLTDVIVADTLSENIHGEIGAITILHVGEERKFTFSHVVTKADVDATKVINYAIGYYTWDKLIDVPVISEPVESPTGPQKGPIPPTHTPDGHIDTPIVKTGQDDACKLTLVSRGDGSAEYELHLCTKHAAIYEKAQRQAQSADAWKQAANEWKVTLDEMYQQILDASTGSARMAVMAERAVFFAYVDSFKAVMNQMHPGEAEIAEKNAAELLMRQCAELCYVTHFAPEDRPDSLFTGDYKALAAASPDAAQCVYTETPNGSELAIRESLCAHHAQIDKTVLTLVHQARTRADAAEAFLRARRLWQSELNDLANSQYKAAEKQDRKLIASCRTLFDSLLEKQEALYSFIYSTKREAVQEALSNAVMLDVIFRCK